ncbi:MAG: TIR domain-containing protein [Chloroflexota bacterium]
MTKIFISHSDKDSDFALQLAKALINKGIDIWIDKSDIRAGKIWWDEIQRGLDECDVMILVTSPDAMDSPYVAKEWGYYITEKKEILPARWKPAKIHFMLQGLQYVDFHEQEFARTFEKLGAELKRQGIAVSGSDGQMHEIHSDSITVLLSILSNDLSILVPMFNEENVIGATLEKLVKRGFHNRFRIIVCDDDSTDNSVKEAESKADGYKSIRVIQNKPNGKKIGAIKTALKHISTPYVLLMDADSMIIELKEGNLDDVVEDMRKRNLAAMGFRIKPYSRNLIESLQRLEYLLFTDAIRRLFHVTGCLTGQAVIWSVDDLKTVLAQHSGIFEGDDLESTILAMLLKPARDNVDYEADRVFVTTTLKENIGQLVTQRSLIWDVGLIRIFFDKFGFLLRQRTPLGTFFRTFFVTEVVAHPFKLFAILLLFADLLFDLFLTLFPKSYSSDLIQFLIELSNTAYSILVATFTFYLLLAGVNIFFIARSKWNSPFRKLGFIIYSLFYMLISCIVVLLPSPIFERVREALHMFPGLILYSFWGSSLVFTYFLWYGVCAFLILYRATYSGETWTETIKLLAYSLLMPLYYGFLLAIPRTVGFGRYIWKIVWGLD